MTDEKKIILINRILIFASILLIIIGVWRGEVGVVLNKAVMVCMQCMGIG